MAVIVDVIGRLGNKPDLRTSPQGTEFITFNLAVEEFNKGERDTTWFTVADFSGNAKRKSEYLNKGSLIRVIGEEKVRIYHDRENNPRLARDIKASYMTLIPTGNGTKQDQQTNDVNCGTLNEQNNQQQVETSNPPAAPVPSQPQSISTQQPAVATSSATTASYNDIEDDLPF